MFARYLSPTHALCFAKIFGTEEHKHLALHFLNAVLSLRGKELLVELEFLHFKQDSVQDPVRVSRESLIDAVVYNAKGEQYIVQIGSVNFARFEIRAQRFAADAYGSTFRQGEKYRDLKGVIFLAITDYVVFSEDMDRYKWKNKTFDDPPNESHLRDFSSPFLKDLSFTVIELPKFKKSLQEIKTSEEQWCYFLKHASKKPYFEEIIDKDSPIAQAYQLLSPSLWREEELQYYDRLVMREADMRGVLAAAESEAYERGFWCAKEEAYEERTKKKLTPVEIAKAFIKDGESKEKVVRVLSLSEEEISQL